MFQYLTLNFAWLDRVIPLAVKRIFLQANRLNLLVRCFDPGFIVVSIQRRPDPQPALGRRPTNQVHDHGMALQRLTTPVLRNMTKQPMLNLVPLACSSWEMAYPHRQFQLIRQPLQLNLPQPATSPIAPASVRHDQQLGRCWVQRPPHPIPPPPHRRHRKRGCVVADAPAHPTLVGCRAVHALRRCLAQRLVREVLGLALPRLSLRFPFPPRILVISYPFLRLCVHRYHRLAAPLAQAYQLIDVLELSVSVRVLLPLVGLAVRLQAVPQLAQQSRDGLMADIVPEADQRLRQVPCTLGGPQQRRCGVATRGRINEFLKVAKQGAIGHSQGMPTAARTTDAVGVEHGWFGVGGVVQFTESSADQRSRQPCGGSDDRNPAEAQGGGFTRGPTASRPFMQQRSEGRILLPNAGYLH